MKDDWAGEFLGTCFLWIVAFAAAAVLLYSLACGVVKTAEVEAKRLKAAEMAYLEHQARRQ